MKLLIEKNVPTDPSKWSYYKSQAKEKFDVYPCVPLDSLAVTKDGLKSYDELEVGEDILTYNLEKDNLEWSPIKNIHYFEDAPLMEIKKATGFRFRCTPNHKWVIRRDENRTPELVEAKDITTHMRIVFSSTMQNDTDLNLINENWGKHDSWVEKIVKMSTQQREIWLSSAIVYDGWEKGKSTKAVGRRTFGFSQKNRDHLLATIYAAYLNGYYVSVNDFDNDVVSVTIIRGKKTHGSQNVIKTQLGERENVWCPETDNKTWVMMQNGWFTITGNSAYANAWAAKQYKDAGGGWRTEESVVNEAKNDPKIISQLRDIVKSGSKVLTDPATGRKMRVDSYSASAIISVYDGLNQSGNKDKFVNSGLLKMQSTAFKILSKFGQPKNEGKRDLGFERGDFVHLKSKNKTGMVLKVQGNKVTILTMNGPVTSTLDDVMILAQDGVNEAKRDLGFERGDFVHLKSKNKTGMVLKVQGNKVAILTMNGPVTSTLDDVMILAQDGVNEAKRDLGFERGDFVHLKSKNKTGMVLKVQGNKVTIRTMNGPVTSTLDDVMILAQDNINEGNAFTGALFNARKQGLSEFEFGGKKYPVINEIDDDEEPSASSIRKAGKEQVAQKREMLKIQKTLKDNAKDTAAFTKIPQNDRTPKQTAHLKKMADLTAKLKKLKTLTEDIDLGHQDDEPNMLRADLYRIVKYATELGEMLKQFDNTDEEVDFPHWWQSDIIRAKELMVNAKHYLNGELNVNGNPLGESKKKVRI